MDFFQADICIPDVSIAREIYGPTLPIALAHELPLLAFKLGKPNRVLGIRPPPEPGVTSDGFRMLIKPNEPPEHRERSYYETREADIADEMEVFDVHEELEAAEILLREAAHNRLFALRHCSRLTEAGSKYMDAINDVLIYDPGAQIPLEENLEDIFRGVDWRGLMPPMWTIPVVDIRNVEIVDRGDDEVLLRFEYYFDNPGGQSVHGRALEFVDIDDDHWRVRHNQYSALRGVDPPFKGVQLRQVYQSLQTALDTGRYDGELWAKDVLYA
ncbi:hypothetical protein [Pararhizobium sp. PWRC1-1]|uniref:hypothetical protein n=1 Tax=Pararhizobium sp. PWRC1-1 TaxID=2804566 RepID=UPI003CEA3501